MHKIYLALGSNLGDRYANLQAAIHTLPQDVLIQEVSKIYETQPWGFTDQPPFLNMVLKGETRMGAKALLGAVKRLETRLGRTTSFQYGPRLIDIDILFFDELVLDGLGLTVPHPHLHERAFVLVPLMDLAPELLHPVLKKSVREMLAGVDTTGVKPYEHTDRPVEK